MDAYNNFQQLGSDGCIINFTLKDTVFQLFHNLALNIAKNNHHIKVEGKHLIPYLK